MKGVKYAGFEWTTMQSFICYHRLYFVLHSPDNVDYAAEFHGFRIVLK